MTKAFEDCYIAIPETGCWIWLGRLDASGYGKLWIRGTKNPRQGIGAHRYSYELNYGPIPEGMFVLHHCDMRPCVRPEHLYLGNAQDNSNDARKRNRFRFPHGTQRPDARLTEGMVMYLRANQNRYSISDWARLYGVTRTMIRKILDHKRWKHVT